jgi:hypothetical protein
VYFGLVCPPSLCAIPTVPMSHVHSSSNQSVATLIFHFVPHLSALNPLPLANPGWLPSSDTSMPSINIYRMPSFGPLLPSTLYSPSTCTLYSGKIYSATLFPVLLSCIRSRPGVCVLHLHLRLRSLASLPPPLFHHPIRSLSCLISPSDPLHLPSLALTTPFFNPPLHPGSLAF